MCTCRNGSRKTPSSATCAAARPAAGPPASPPVRTKPRSESTSRMIRFCRWEPGDIETGFFRLVARPEEHQRRDLRYDTPGTYLFALTMKDRDGEEEIAARRVRVYRK